MIGEPRYDTCDLDVLRSRSGGQMKNWQMYTRTAVTTR